MRTLLDHRRLLTLAAAKAETMDAYQSAVIVEVGSYRGGSAEFLALGLPAREVHVFDTWRGMPAEGLLEGEHGAGSFSDFDRVEVLQRLVSHDNIRIHEGRFPDTLPRHFPPVCVGHYDGDTGQGCADFLAVFWPLLVAGGVLVFDDYGWRDCPHIAGIVDAFAECEGLAVERTAEYQARIVKPCQG